MLWNVIVKKGEGRYSSSWAVGNPISELRDVTCHVGSHSVTCYPTPHSWGVVVTVVLL